MTNIAFDPNEPDKLAQVKLASAYSVDTLPLLAIFGLTKDSHVSKVVLTIDSEDGVKLDVTRYVTEDELATLKDYLTTNPPKEQS